MDANREPHGGLHPEHLLSGLAVLVGLIVGVGVVASSGTMPGCAAEQCQPPRNVRKPTAVLECPSGTLCYQGACVASCASGSERVEKCESDDDCTSAVRPNCVDRRCSSCNDGERCIPALDICSPIRASDNDAGEPNLNPTRVPGVAPVDGGTIDGSPLTFDSGEEVVVVDREVTHLLSIDIAQRTDLRGVVTTTSAIRISSLDVRNTGRVASSTVGPPDVDFTHECTVKHVDRYTTPPVGANLGRIQLQPDQGPAMRDFGLTASFVADFVGGRYQLTPLPQPNLILPSSMAGYRSVEITGAGAPNVTLGSFPPGADASDIFVPDVFNLTAASRNALINVDVRNTDAVIQLAWEKGVRLAGGRVLVEVRNSACVLRCSFVEEQNTAGRITAVTLNQFRNAPCNGAGNIYDIFVDRAVGGRVDTNSDFDGGIYVLGEAEIRIGFIGRIAF